MPEYEPRISDEEQALLMRSAMAREARRADKLSELKPPEPPILGKQRVSAYEFRNPDKPEVLPFTTVSNLGRLLYNESILTDEITKYYNPRADSDSIVRYLNGPVVGNRHADIQSKRRAFAHTLDGLVVSTETKYRAALLGRASIASVQQSIKSRKDLHVSAARYAAAAIEDFGICLRGRTDITDQVDHREDLPTYFEQLGVFAVDNPEVLREQGDVLRLVRLEQYKRVGHWGALLRVITEKFPDRTSTILELDGQQTVDELLESFGQDSPTSV